MNNFYENSGYSVKHRKKTLLLDIVDETEGTGDLFNLGVNSGRFDVMLYEPLVIDKYSEIYLDSFSSMNSNIVNASSNGAFLLKVDQFNIRTNVASTNFSNSSGGGVDTGSSGAMYESIFIPNENTNPNNMQTVVLHKSKKFNYVGDINPTRISRLTGEITNLNGGPIFHGLGEGRHTYTITGIASGTISASGALSINPETSFTNIEISGITTQAVNGSFIVDTLTSSTSLHFATNASLSTSMVNAINDFNNSGSTIEFTLSPGPGTVTISGGSGSQPNLMLINNPGRFIAEFSINVVE